jgi:hypothetical protein
MIIKMVMAEGNGRAVESALTTVCRSHIYLLLIIH